MFLLFRQGFVNTRHCRLVNTSLIPMTFNLRVPADGGVRGGSRHSLGDSLVDSNISDPGSSMLAAPQEFTITPSTGTVAPQSSVEIKVTPFKQNAVLNEKPDYLSIRIFESIYCR